MAQGKQFTEEEKEKILRSLKQYFTLGYNRTKACMFVGFPRTTLQSWEDSDEALRIKIDGWINSVNAKAREVVVKKINNKDNPDTDLAKWWLERREKKDFSTRTENAVEITSADDIIKKLKKEEDVLQLEILRIYIIIDLEN